MPPGPETSTTGKHIPALDGLRGIAILMVLVVHALDVSRAAKGPVFGFFTGLTGLGWMGVDLFFVLSGFLITGILYDTLQSPHFFRNFYARRTLRVFPLYYGFMALCIALSAALGAHWTARTFLYLTYTNNLDVTLGTYTSTRLVNFNHFWSLAVEEQFYLLWPLLVFWLRSRRRIVGAALLIAMASLAVRCALVFSGATVAHPYLAYMWTPARVDTLLLGAMLAIAVRSAWRDRILALAPWAAASGIVMILVYLAVRGEFNFLTDRFVATFGVLLAGITSCGLVASALTVHAGERGFARWLGAAPLRFFGRYSYGLYVMHYTILAIVTAYLFAPIARAAHSVVAGMVGTTVITVALSVAAAVTSFHFFEQPLLRLKRHFQDGSPAPKLRRVLARPARVKAARDEQPA